MQTSLPKQFIVCRQEAHIPAGWTVSEFGGYLIGRSPEIGLVRLLADTGELRGVALGWPIYNGRLLITAGGPKDADLSVSVEDFLHDGAGRYLVLHEDAAGVHAVPDAGGFLGSVYCPELDMLAATTALIPETEGNRAPSVLYDLLRIGERTGYYPFGYTNRQNIFRLTPNTSLRMGAFEVSRFDYMPPDRYASGVPSDLIPQIVAGVKANVEAVAQSGPAALHLTAGYDSRMMLAAARDCLDRIEIQTIDFDYYIAKLDVHVARKICRRFGLNHKVYPFVETPADEIEAWVRRTGNCVRDQVTDLSRTADTMDLGGFSIMGTTGEVGRGRAHYWRREELHAPPPDARGVLQRLGFPADEHLLRAAEGWLDSINATSATMVWDKAYIEQRVGCWTGATVYGHMIKYPSLSPFNARSLFDKMLRLPVDYRFEEQFTHDFVTSLWPELLEFEINRPSGFDRLLFWRSELSYILPPQAKAVYKTLKKRLAS